MSPPVDFIFRFTLKRSVTDKRPPPADFIFSLILKKSVTDQQAPHAFHFSFHLEKYVIFFQSETKVSSQISTWEILFFDLKVLQIVFMA